MTFKNDIVDGLTIEGLYEKHLVEMHSDTIDMVSACSTNRYDLIAHTRDGKYFTFEIKHERYKDGDTKQFCVEYLCNGKPSGICTSKADYYVFIFENKFLKEWEAWRIRRKDLLAILLSKARTLPDIYTEKHGTRFYLFPRNDFIKDFRIEIININKQKQFS